MSWLAVDANGSLAAWDLAVTWFVMALRQRPDAWRCACRRCRGVPFVIDVHGWTRDAPWLPPVDFEQIATAPEP
jgi:hypothetical protein